ncbi:MAG: sigma-70 family RNA polymerase sigma factor [Rhodocyclales bacterium GT-UBC]|nr:MAG: sigma-70 family RNA polymerase sigma factor [Rhodocyclales bacterium GT-UBC]
MSAAHLVAHLYVDHYAWLHGWLRRKIGCTHLAADLTQDTFVRVLGGREVAQLNEPRAYLMTLAQRVLFSFWRRRDLEQAWLEALAQQTESQAPSAEDYALVREAIETLDRLLAGLPLRARRVFLMNRLDELSYPEIARQIGVSLATVERDMKRALTQCWLVGLDRGATAWPT